MPQQTVEKWDVFEAEFGGPKGGSPYLDVAFDAIFRHKAREIRVPGFMTATASTGCASCRKPKANGASKHALPPRR